MAIDEALTPEALEVLLRLGAFPQTIHDNLKSLPLRIMKPVYWADAEMILRRHGGRYSRRRLANNTYLERNDRGLPTVYLHGSPIITYFPGGVILDDCNWPTVTTFGRISLFSMWDVTGVRTTFGSRRSLKIIVPKPWYVNWPKMGKSGVRREDVQNMPLWEPPMTMMDRRPS